MEPCQATEGCTALVVLELFERMTTEPFSQTPGTLVASRIRALAKVLGNISREQQWDPPLQSVVREGGLLWSRRPKVPGDAAAWRAAVEAHSAPVPRLQLQMKATNKDLAEWIKGHRYLIPAEVEAGESGMALLLLWEGDHQRSFPRMGGRDLSTGLLKSLHIHRSH